MSKTTHSILVVGAGTMGLNLAINLRNGGAAPILSDVNASALRQAKSQTGLEGYEDIASASAALRTPRIALIMVPAGDATDHAIEALVDEFSEGDIIIEGGNADYRDTARRHNQINSRGLYFLGCGISGGAQGAREGVSVMAGGDRAGFDLARGLLESIAARAKDEPCCGWMGHGGAGHFVKMVHNAIEYGLMQIIAEAYLVLRHGVGLQPEAISNHMSHWLSDLPTSSYLLEITAEILSKTDNRTDGPLIDVIVGRALENGTARWAVEAAMELGFPAPIFASAVQARHLSAATEERAKYRKEFQAPTEAPVTGDLKPDQVRCAIAGATLAAYAQGFGLIQAASEANGWHTNLRDVARIWRNGCIIRHGLLDLIADGFNHQNETETLISLPPISALFRDMLPGWRCVAATGLLKGVPVPTMASGLAWFDALCASRCGAELIQAQRDMFGHHGFERIGQPGRWHIE